MSKINVAIIGAGNCAKSLLEGVAFYTENPSETTGLMHPDISGYSVADINFVAAFDIDQRKVGYKLHEAINMEPNSTIRIADPLEYDVLVQRGPTHDSVTPQARKFYIHESSQSPVDVVDVLKRSSAEIVVNYLPTGSDRATYAYAEAALKAGCSFINCMPTPIAKNVEWQERFENAGLVLMGDDVKSQLGATILNRFLLTLFKMRGITVTQSDQTNYGGNADHHNLSIRPEAKEESKEAALGSVLTPKDAKPVARMIYTPENYDHKRAVILVKGEMFGRIPVSISVSLEDEDSPNSAGMVVDAIRMAKVLRDGNKASQAAEACAWLMKSPPRQMHDADALSAFNSLIL